MLYYFLSYSKKRRFVLWQKKCGENKFFSPFSDDIVNAEKDKSMPKKGLPKKGLSQSSVVKFSKLSC